MTRDFNYHAEKFLFVGNSEMGKSTLQLHHVRNFKFQFPRSKKHKFIYDHKGQFGPALGGFVAKTHAEFCACIAQTGHVIFNPSVEFPKDHAAGFRWFCGAVWEIQQHLPGTNHESLLVFDEAGILVPWERTAYESHPLRWHIDTGREWRWNMLATGQTAGDLSRGARRQLTKIFALRHTTAASAEVLTKDYGYKLDELNKLGRGEFIAYSVGTAKFDPKKKLRL